MHMFVAKATGAMYKNYIHAEKQSAINRKDALYIQNTEPHFG